jgi:nucleotide-binding universal stress UspA family protein
MSSIVAAIDNSAAARPVLSMATALGAVFGADVAAIHVSEDDGQTASAIAETFGIPCEILRGDPFTRIAACAGRDDVVALVVGARRRIQGGSAGHLARQVADAVEKPVLVVPPESKPIDRLRRVLIAMEGTSKKARSIANAIDIAAGADLDLTVVHVDDEDSIPQFSDQVAHETDAYATEFLARYLRGAPDAHLELRIGVPADEIIDITNTLDPDLVAIGWPHVAGEHRGAVARDILDRSHVPVLLVAVTD